MCQTTTTTKSPIQNGIIKSSNSSHGSSSLLKTFSLRLSKKSKHHHYRHDNQHEESSSSSIDQSPSSSSSAQPLNVANDVNIYRNLLPIITHVQLLWELVLTNEPIAVISQTPNVCSEIVQALIALIAPLRYGADYRPFFTIHDSEFKEYTTHTKSP